MYLYNLMILTNIMTVYSTIRIVFTVIAFILFLILVVYGYRVRIDVILSKKLGFRKKRELEQMKAGKALQRRRVTPVASNQQTEQIHMHALQEDEGTALLEQTEVLRQEEDEDATMVLNQKPKDVFCVTKNVIVVHGKALL